MSPTKAKPKEKPKKRSERPIKGGRKDGVQLIPQPHGGALLPGGQKGQTPGPGRPPNEIRERLRDLGLTKGIPFLAEIMDGKLAVQIVGECPSCKVQHPLPDQGDIRSIADQMQATVDHRLKALEQAWKYGLGTKDELDVSSHPEFAKQAQAYQSCVSDAVRAACSPTVAERILDDIAHRIDALTKSTP